MMKTSNHLVASIIEQLNREESRKPRPHFIRFDPETERMFNQLKASTGLGVSALVRMLVRERAARDGVFNPKG